MLLLCQFGSRLLQFCKVPFMPTVPLFTVLMVTGTWVPGTSAILTALFVNGPAMPGPLRKNPKMSFTVPHTYSSYSSEPNT